MTGRASSRAPGFESEDQRRSAAGGTRQARRIQVRGVVQGVGFRPFVHRLASRHGLAGWVRNESGAVFIEVEGSPDALREFTAGLRSEAPVLARIEGLEDEAVPPRGIEGFRVLESRSTEGRLPVSPDVATCAACRAELFDPADRRFRYPFITCTDCGPRYTVIEGMPYDRGRTSMRHFPQCPACLREYSDPTDRRFHSETNSCPDCGPRVWMTGPDGEPGASGEAAVQEAAKRLLEGQIVAIRGLGGYHLACDATDEGAVRRLRERKVREAKPLAVMVADVERARQLCRISFAEEAVLTGAERPILLLRARADTPLAPSISPGLDAVGVMLAYTPLHLLLLDRTERPLVMTSGNLSELPICTGNTEAHGTLDRVADAFLMHDRDIVARYDDSVLRFVSGTPVFVRRARGYAPLPVPMPVNPPQPLLAVGPHLKNTFCLAADGVAFVSQHVGDLENVETLDHYREALIRFRSLFHVEPEAVARDLHPGYLSTRIAEEMGLPRVIEVQHHHAHVAAVAGEHDVRDPVIGIAFDGTGYGDDGHVWGAEILLADLVGYRRLARLRYAPMPGGDVAARSPWRVAAGYASLDPDRSGAFENAFRGVDPTARRIVEAQIDRNVNAPLASSMGRLFDAAAAVLGVRGESLYEGQAAMELEALASRYLSGRGAGRTGQADPVDRLLSPGVLESLQDLAFPEAGVDSEVRVLDPVPLLAELGERCGAGEDTGRLAAVFHAVVGGATVDLAASLCAIHGVERVAIGGGVFQNALLLAIVGHGLEARGLVALSPRRLGPNDGAISYGQAVVAAARLSVEHGR